MISDLDLFAIVLGHVCADAREMEAMLKGTAIVRLNYEPRTVGIQNLLRQKPCEGAKTYCWAKLGKETGTQDAMCAD
jgi:hypothetical protein